MIGEDDLKGLPYLKRGWNDCTDLHACDKRKKSFKVFQKSPDVELLHVFTAGIYYGTEYFHVIHEDFKETRPSGAYQLMTKEELENKFSLKF